MSKEKPILFSTPMVQEIWTGRKTKSRRVAKFRPIRDGLNFGWSGLVPVFYHPGDNQSAYVLSGRRVYGCWEDKTHPLNCPYGKPGDILWVRETWCNINKDSMPPEYYYLADCLQPWVEDYNPSDWKWKPSIHMPRSAARLFLKVKSIRIERLQDITEDDAKAEGITTQFLDIIAYSDDSKYQKFHDPENPDICRLQFEILWDSLNKKRGYGWNLNPWVWVIEFEKVDKPC